MRARRPLTTKATNETSPATTAATTPDWRSDALSVGVVPTRVLLTLKRLRAWPAVRRLVAEPLARLPPQRLAEEVLDGIPDQSHEPVRDHPPALVGISRVPDA